MKGLPVSTEKIKAPFEFEVAFTPQRGTKAQRYESNKLA